MIPPCCVAALGRALNVSLVVCVQSLRAGWSRTFCAVFVVVVRSPVLGVIVSEPGFADRLQSAGASRTHCHCEPSVEPLNSSPDGRLAKLTWYVVTMPSGPVDVTVATPGTEVAWVIATLPVRAVALTCGTALTPFGTTTSYVVTSGLKPATCFPFTFRLSRSESTRTTNCVDFVSPR